MYKVLIMKNDESVTIIHPTGIVSVLYNDDIIYNGCIQGLTKKFLDPALGIFNIIKNINLDHAAQGKMHSDEDCKNCHNAFSTYKEDIFDVILDDNIYINIAYIGYCNGVDYSIYVGVTSMDTSITVFTASYDQEDICYDDINKIFGNSQNDIKRLE